MGLLLLAAFIGVPLLEIAVFIQVGGLIGLWPTLAIVVLTAILGTWQLRVQGLATLARARAEIDRGGLPARELFTGACLLVAGVLLLTPGFVTDALGFLLFLPPFREMLRALLTRWVETHVETRTTAHRRDAGQPAGAPVIDAEYREIDEDAEPCTPRYPCGPRPPADSTPPPRRRPPE